MKTTLVGKCVSKPRVLKVAIAIALLLYSSVEDVFAGESVAAK